MFILIDHSQGKNTVLIMKWLKGKVLKKEDPTMIFIYGEADPWSASDVCTWLDCRKKANMRVYVQPGGDHGSDITNMPEPDKSDIMDRLNKWLK